MNYQKLLSPTVFAGALFSIPQLAQAAITDALTNPIFPEACNCPEAAPDYGCILQVLQNVINLGISIGIIIATLWIAYAGFMFMISSANPGALEQGRARLLNIVVGLMVLLSAWLIVDFIMKTLYSEPTEFGPWNSILAGDGNDSCIVKRESVPITQGVIQAILNPGGGSSSGGGYTGTKGCPTCIPLQDKGFSCKNNCTLDPVVADKLLLLKNAFNGKWIVTEAYPPTSNHSNQCHYNGTCIDAGFTSPTKYTAGTMSAFAQAARSSGLRPVFETFDCNLRNTARTAGVEAYCSSDAGYGGITGSHFSVYGN
jgi:hypothetical protein